MEGANAAAENQRTAEKQLRILENRLDQALVKFNKSLANNRRLREKIDNLRGERIAFEGVYKKLEKVSEGLIQCHGKYSGPMSLELTFSTLLQGLQDRKRQMAQVIEQSNVAYEQRDKSRLEIMAIDQSDKKEQDHFDKQMEEMGRVLEAEINEAANRRKNQNPNLSNADEESKIAAEKAAQANALMKERETLAREREEKIHGFEEAFQRIEEATGISDVDELVQVFKENDEQNFSLFTFANEQTNEINCLEEEVQALRAEQSMSNSKVSGESREYEQKLNGIATVIEASKRQEEKFMEKTVKCQTELDSLKDGIKVRLPRIHILSSHLWFFLLTISSFGLDRYY